MQTISKLLLISIFLVCSFSQTTAQLQFQNTSLDDAIQKAASSGKIVLANFVSASCSRCDEVANKNFAIKKLHEFILKKCIPLRISLDNKDRQKFIDEYNPDKKMGIYFISGNGELVHVLAAVLSSKMPQDKISEFYIYQIEQAYSKLAEGKASLKELDEEWRKNPTDIIAMELNLNRRKSLGLATDSLLDEYVKRLPTDSLTSSRTLRFIAQLAPSLFSPANEVLRAKYPNFLKAWFTMDLPTRIAINKKVISSSMKKAIALKNVVMANKVANFSDAINDNKVAGQKSYYRQLLNYYSAVKDTLQSLSLTSFYYDRYYISQSKDSLLKNVAKKQEDFHNHVLKKHTDTSMLADSSNYKIIYNEIMQSYTGLLNNAAWYIYTTTPNPKYLYKALEWAERAINVYESPEALDTYARLLYVTGNTTKAIKVQKQAIILLQNENFDTTNYTNALHKMEKQEVLQEINQ